MKFKLFSLLVIVFFISCDEPKCTSSNPIFNNNEYTSEIYQEELANVLGKSNPEELQFWLKSYTEDENNKYLNVSVQGNDICAVAVIKINNIDSKIKGIVDSKGVGYRGAELKNLKFVTLKDKKSTRFIYRSLDTIID
ncbi:hypothetical protein [Flavobacterium sp.]|jgi:hypothetical protein|uniref:hypothetical protein n=1 Tax=Flavobacterium sp. TaxID=239 RepID=UPI002A80E358|nr:hypothetical protein [Flavobacterium sp.]